MIRSEDKDCLLETFASYVPALVLRRLETDLGSLTAPLSEHYDAALLSADISGFTQLTNQLVQQHQDGVEELSLILNAYFGQLIDLVMAHGGDIIEFTGDGLLAIWPAAVYGEDVATVIYRAAQCGLMAQQVLNGHEFANGVRLFVRIGVGTGEVLVATVGGMLGRWELLMAGEPLTQVSAAQGLAAPGDVVLSNEAWELVKPWCTGYPVGYSSFVEHGYREKVVGYREWYAARQSGKVEQSSTGRFHNGFHLEHARRYLPPRPLPEIAIRPEMVAAIRSYLPGALLARLDAGLSDWVAELRRVTVLFINVEGVPYDAADILERLQHDMLELQAIMYRYEGSLNQFIVDDKGTLLIVALGLPPLTHEDDAVRGVQMALDIQQRLRERGLGGAIGITTGRIFCGSRGNQRRRDYAMIGDVMNMAARLMQAARDDVLCDEPTYQAAQTALAFDVLPPIMVKGNTEPVPVYRPYGRVRATVCHRTVIVGRAAEQKLLSERLRVLSEQGVGSVVLIEGEAGMGKSRLVDFVLERAQGWEIGCWRGKGDAIEQATPYHIWQALFWQLFGLDDDPDTPESHRLRVFSVLEDDAAIMRLLPLLNAVLPLDLADNEITQQMIGQVRADNTRELLLRVVQHRTRRGPSLIVLEDANWLDSASWALTMAISQHIPSLMLVITTRPLSDPSSGVALLKGSLEFELSQATGDGPPGLSDVCPFPFATTTADGAEYGYLLRRADAYRLVLGALSYADTSTLVGQYLGVAQVPERVGALIYERAQGNPFFSQELAYALRDAGMVTIADGVCQIAPGAPDLDGLHFPETVQGVIISRIDRLNQSQQLALKIASVIGQVVEYPILYDIYPVASEKPALPTYLHTFERLDIMRMEKATPSPVYAFRHIITQEVVYTMLLAAQRRDLHRAVAEWYERVHADDLTHYLELLVHHWSKAEVPERVMQYAEQAGEQALRTFANQEAVQFFERALALPGGNRARLERLLGEAYLGLGDLRASRHHLEQSAAALGRPVPADRRVLSAWLVQQVARQAWHRFARGWHRYCSFDARRVLAESAHIYGLLASVYYLSNDTFRAMYASVRCLNLTERTGEYSRWLSYAYAHICMMAGSVMLHTVAASYGRRALAVAWQGDDAPMLAYVLNLNGLYRVGVGHWRYARGALEVAAGLCERFGDWTMWGATMTLLAQVAYYQGDFERSYELFRHLSEQAQQQGNMLHRAWAAGGLGQNALRLGRLDEAARLLEEAIAWLSENADRASLISNYGLLAMVHARREQWPEARAAADEAVALIEALPLPTAYYLIEGYAGVAEVYLGLWQAQPPGMDGAAVAAGARQACQRLHGFARFFPIGRPRAWLCQGMLEWLSGRRGRALLAWYRSLAAAERLGMRYEQTRARVWLGRR